MYELTNDQRKCFALASVSDQWDRIEAKPSPYDQFKTYLYLDGDTIVKCILSGDSLYCEYELSEMISADRKYLLPKTAKGKPIFLSSSSIQKRHGIGMRLNYIDKNIHLYNEKNECSYYFNSYFDDGICDLNSFSQWVEKWCDETTGTDIADISKFSHMERRHIRYQEGDVFRFKIGRRLYGYGRILLDYDRMRKKKEPFWDILMCKPVVCSVYHIVTDRSDLSVDELKSLRSLPSTTVTDNSLYYGEYDIIGNIPIGEYEDYPIMYGDSIRAGEKAVYYQCGRTYRRIENGTALYSNYKNNGVSNNLNFTLDILLKCIKEHSNNPYWENFFVRDVEHDLRNPKYANKLVQIKKQFDL